MVLYVAQKCFWQNSMSLFILFLSQDHKDIFIFSYKRVFCFVLFFVCIFLLLLLLLFVFLAMPAACGNSQARDWTEAVATDLCHSHSNIGSEPHLLPIPQLTATLDPLTYWAKPESQLPYSWILVRFITSEPQWELLCKSFILLALIFRSLNHFEVFLYTI